MNLKYLYELLFQAYGLQGWWPLSKGGLHPKHHNGPPISESDKFEIMVGAILTQNTTWTNVEKVLHNLKKKNLLNLNKMHKAKESQLGEAIRSSGYFNQKAKKLKNLTTFLKKNSFQELQKKENIRETILAIHGVGPETADCILLYALEKPFFIIDAYTKRILTRVTGITFSSYQEWQDYFMQNLKNDVKLFKEFHALFVEHAKKYCKTKPICKGCPLETVCKSKSL